MAAEEVKTTPTVEKQTNCPACNKQIRKLKRYYRDGKFYCDKECWRKVAKPKTQEGEV